jgi:UDP-N-acetylmuramoyl-L-alanyl-D-glutamate--2,6-diaminopimelate ligase
MLLKDLLYEVKIQSVSGNLSVPVKALQTDSRKVQPGDCFIAIRGTHSDGHAYIAEVASKGAVAVVCQTLPERREEGVVYVQVDDSAVAAGWMSHVFHGEPSSQMSVTGVTGTNGKTTVATLLFKLFSGMGYRCGLISTAGNVIINRSLEASHTTPDQLNLHKLLSEMQAEGCTHVFMECSSHAIHQHRIAGVRFAGAIFTNITHDHLDYHKTFDEYIRVKKSWFDGLPSSSFAISNADDKRGAIMLQNTPAKKHFYSLRSLAEFKGKILDNSLLGLHMVINETDVHFKLIGTFNASNLLAAYGAAICLGEDKAEVLRVLSSVTGAEGRFDYMISSVDRVVGIVDYAHTPDALINVLATIRQLRQGVEKVITVVGCGGDRDKSKRPVMAEVACEHSDKVIFTSDNPRTEDPMEILKEMEAGVGIALRKKYITIPDRKEAIKTAVALSEKKDIILLAGKGHEKYQEINGVRYPFDDKQVLNEMFELLDK